MYVGRTDPGCRPLLPMACMPVCWAQVLLAFWKVGLLRPMPFPEKWNAPSAVGSGKLGTPLARMHSANFTSAAWFCRCGVLPPIKAFWAAVRYGLQGAKLGPFVNSRPLDVTGTMITLLALMVGSLWPGSPWLRMQTAHSSSSWVGEPVGVPTEVPPDVEFPMAVEFPLSVLLVPKLATDGELGPLLHYGGRYRRLRADG